MNTLITPIYNNKNTTHTQSFGGLTKVLKKHHFSPNGLDELYQYNGTNTDIVGTLPPDIINLVKKVATEKEAKGLIIKKINTAFSKAARALSGVKHFDGFQDLFFQKLYASFLEARSYLSLRRAQNALNKTFKKLKLIKKNETINIEEFNANKGRFGRVFYIKFPKSSNVSDKTIKIFKHKNPVTGWLDTTAENSDATPFFIRPPYGEDKLVNHGLLPEANNALYVSSALKGKFKKAIFSQSYFASIKNRYIISEKAQNYDVKPAPNKNAAKSELAKINISYKDLHASNVVNGRIIDYGGTEEVIPNMTKGMNKAYQMLNKAWVRVWQAKSPKATNKAEKKLVRLIDKLMKGEKKVELLDVKSAIRKYIQNNLSNNIAPSILEKLKKRNYTIINGHIIQNYKRN